MARGKPTQNVPYKMFVEEGKSYYWCSCGLSSNQPYCDGNHEGSEFKPIRFTADKKGFARICGCRSSENAPICDGSHMSLDKE